MRVREGEGRGVGFWIFHEKKEGGGAERKCRTSLSQRRHTAFPVLFFPLRILNYLARKKQAPIKLVLFNSVLWNLMKWPFPWRTRNRFRRKVSSHFLFLGLRPFFSLPLMYFHENDVRLISIKRGGWIEGCTRRVVVCRRRCRRSGARKHNKLEAAPVRARGPPPPRQPGLAGLQANRGGRVITLRFSCSLSFPHLLFGIQKKSKGKRSFFFLMTSWRGPAGKWNKIG